MKWLFIILILGVLAIVSRMGRMIGAVTSQTDLYVIIKTERVSSEQVTNSLHWTYIVSSQKVDAKELTASEMECLSDGDMPVRLINFTKESICHEIVEVNGDKGRMSLDYLSTIDGADILAETSLETITDDSITLESVKINSRLSGGSFALNDVQGGHDVSIVEIATKHGTGFNEKRQKDCPSIRGESKYMIQCHLTKGTPFTEKIKKSVILNQLNGLGPKHLYGYDGIFDPTKL